MSNAFNAVCPMSIRSIVSLRGTNENGECRFFSPEKAPHGVPGIPGSSLGPLWRSRRAHERQLRSDRDIIRWRRARTFVLAHLHTRTELSLHCGITAARSGVGVRDAEAGRVRDLVHQGGEIGKTCKGCMRERSVGEMNGEDTTERRNARER